MMSHQNPPLRMLVRSCASSISRAPNSKTYSTVSPLNSFRKPIQSWSEVPKWSVASDSTLGCSSSGNAVSTRRGDSFASLSSSKLRFGNASQLFDSSFRKSIQHRRLGVCRTRVSLAECRERGLSRSFSAGFGENGGNGFGGSLQEGLFLSSRLRLKSPQRRFSVVPQAGAAAGASSLSPPAPPSVYWKRLVANFLALWASITGPITARLRSIQIGGFDLFSMLRLVIFGAAAFAAYIVAKRAWKTVQETAAGQGGGGDGGPMQILAKGATCLQSNMGPWSITDLALGLTAMAKVTEKQPPPLPGKEAKDLSQDSAFLLRAQHWRTLSEAAYVQDSASFSLFSGLPESALVAASWEPHQETFRPAYAVFVDAPFGAVVLAVRGTSHIIDMILNSGASPEPFGDSGGYAHGGFVHASNVLYDEVKPLIEKAFKDIQGVQKDLKLVICGHSMGAAVGALIALKLRKEFPELEMWGYCPPACMSMDLAKECKGFTTSFVAAHDLVPRFSLHSVEKLRNGIQEFDWDQVEKVAKDDEDWPNLKKAIDVFNQMQKTQEQAADKLRDIGTEHSEGLEKARDLVQQAVNSEAGQKIVGAVKNLAGEGGEGDENQGEERKGGDEGEEKMPVAFHPPGKLLVLGSDPPGCGKMPEARNGVASERQYGTYPSFDEAKKISWKMYEAEQEELENIVVSPWCVSDHMLGNLCEGIGFLQSHAAPVFR